MNDNVKRYDLAGVEGNELTEHPHVVQVPCMAGCGTMVTVTVPYTGDVFCGNCPTTGQTQPVASFTAERIALVQSPLRGPQIFIDSARQREFERGKQAGIKEGLKMAAKVAENEPEPGGDMPQEVRDALQKVSLEEQQRVAVRATKISIATAIRKLSEASDGSF